VKSGGVLSASGGSLTSPYDKLVIGAGRQRNINFFKGDIDDIKIFDCAFTSVQVDSIFLGQTLYSAFDTLSVDTTLCLGDTLFFNLDGSSNIDYLWDNGSVDTLRSLTNPGVYTLSQSRGGDTLLDTIRLSFSTPYSPTFLDTSFCSGDTINLDYSALNVDSLVWFDGSTNRQRSFNTAGTFTFYIYQEYCGVTRDSITISLDTVLSPISQDTSSCQNSVLIGARSESYLTYLWSSGQGTPNIQVNQSGIYTVRVSGACNSVIDTFRVELPVLLPVQSPADTLFICSNNDSVQIGISIDPNLFFIWSNSANNTLQWISQAGEYSLQVFNNCDTIENHYTILNESLIRPEPLPDTTVCELNRLNLNLNHIGVDDIYVNGNILFSNTLSISSGGVYIVEYEQECGLLVDTFFVDQINCECDFIMPDAFTPNNDGLNDKFRVDNQCETLEHNIQIFNRWGVLVFENKSNTDFWDGRHKGREISSGVYIYRMNYEGIINGKTYRGIKKGYITLIR